MAGNQGNHQNFDPSLLTLTCFKKKVSPWPTQKNNPKIDESEGQYSKPLHHVHSYYSEVPSNTMPAEMFGGSDFWLEPRVIIKILTIVANQYTLLRSGSE